MVSVRFNVCAVAVAGVKARQMNQHIYIYIMFTTQIGERIEKVDVDGDVLKAFMRTKALEGMAGAILYTGIFEFMQKADVIGNVVNSLPIIGPVRQQVNVALKDVVSPCSCTCSCSCSCSCIHCSCRVHCVRAAGEATPPTVSAVSSLHLQFQKL